MMASDAHLTFQAFREQSDLVLRAMIFADNLHHSNSGSTWDFTFDLGASQGI